ncbi:IS5 family transposase [Streptomyces lavendulocolor]
MVRPSTIERRCAVEPEREEPRRDWSLLSSSGVSRIRPSSAVNPTPSVVIAEAAVRLLRAGCARCCVDGNRWGPNARTARPGGRDHDGRRARAEGPEHGLSAAARPRICRARAGHGGDAAARPGEQRTDGRVSGWRASRSLAAAAGRHDGAGRSRQVESGRRYAGRPLAFVVTAGNRNDCTQAKTVIGRIRVARPRPGRPRTRPDHIVADKGYSDRSFRAYLRQRGIKATIPERVDQLAGRKRRRERPCGFDKAAYQRRNVVERCFHRLKQWRGIATRYDKRPDRYLAAIALASTLNWLDT